MNSTHTPPALAVGYTIRDAEHGDVSSIKQLIDTHLENLIQRSLAEILEQIAEGRVWVAFSPAGELVGCIMLEVYSNRLAEIRSLAVHEKHRRKYIGENLVQKAVDLGLSLNIRDILAITDSIRFFSKAGFGPATREKFAVFYQK